MKVLFVIIRLVENLHMVNDTSNKKILIHVCGNGNKLNANNYSP